MYILGIVGSPRKRGLSDVLVDSALEGAASEGCHVEKIFLSDLDIKPCQECGGCSDTGSCVVNDGMGKVRREINEADAVIIASPIYFGSITAQLKAMIDRFEDAWTAKYVLRNHPVNPKPRFGALIAVAGGDNSKYFENAKQIVGNLFATLDIEFAGELFLGGIDMNKREGRLEEATKKAFDLGVKLARSQ
jgi:multimeric flavodoxin WrbA